MKTFYVDYISSMDNDVAHVWVYANTKQDAEVVARHEYWDIKEVIGIREAR